MSFLALLCDPIPNKVEWDKTDLLENIRVMYFKSVFSPNGYAYAGLEYTHCIYDKTEFLIRP